MVTATPARSRPPSALSSSTTSRLPPRLQASTTASSSSTMRSPPRPASALAPTTPARAGRVIVEPTTAKRVPTALSTIRAPAASRVVSGGAGAGLPGRTGTLGAGKIGKVGGEGDKGLARPGRVLVSKEAAAGSSTVKPLSKAPLGRSVSASHASEGPTGAALSTTTKAAGKFLGSAVGKPPPSALKLNNSISTTTVTTPFKRKAAHSSSDSSNFSDLSIPSPSTRTPRARPPTNSASATPLRSTSMLDSPSTVRPTRSLTASSSSTAYSNTSTIRQPHSTIGRGPPPTSTNPNSTARKLSSTLKSSTSASHPLKTSASNLKSSTSSQTTPQRPTSLTKPPPPPSTLRATRPPPLKRPSTSSIPISAAKNVRVLKKTSAGPSIGEDEEEEADDERLERKISQRASVAKENVGPCNQVPLSVKGKEKERRESWETMPPSSRNSLGGQAQAQTRSMKKAQSKDSLRPLPYARPRTQSQTQPPSRPQPPNPASHPQIHLSKPSTLPSSSSSDPIPIDLDDYSPAADESWETVESRRLSSLSLGTPTRPLELPPHSSHSLLQTSPPLLPSRIDLSYVSPDPSTLRRALNQLAEATDSPAFVTPVAGRRMKRTGRDSVGLEEMLKGRLGERGGRKEVDGEGEGEDDFMLCDEGVSISMRKEMEGVGTPWRGGSVVERERVGHPLRRSHGPEMMLEFENKAREDEGKEMEMLRAELEEAKSRASEAEQRKEDCERIRREEMRRLAEVKEEMKRKEEEFGNLREEMERKEAEQIDLEGEWEEERMRLEELARARPSRSLSRSSSKATLANTTVKSELELVGCMGAEDWVAREWENLEEGVKAEREVLRAQVDALRVLGMGLRVWEALVD